MNVSLLFPAFNRLEFTRQSWAALMANTDWSLVSEFHVYDDGSTDGTREWLQEQVSEGYRRIVNRTNFHSPMGVTLDWIKRSTAPILAKLDNDTIYPPGWLNDALEVMHTYPSLDCLGLECMRTPVMGTESPRGYLPAKYISGLGLYRRKVFENALPEDNGYFGLEEFMTQHCRCGWILPSLPTFLLDRLPFDPWKSLSEEYVKKGWQRPWSLELRYKPEQEPMWNWWRPVE